MKPKKPLEAGNIVLECPECQCISQGKTEKDMEHICMECGQDITKKECKEYGGMCHDCMWLVANF